MDGEVPTMVRIGFGGMSIQLDVNSVVMDVVGGSRPNDPANYEVADVDAQCWQFGFAQPLVEALRQEIRRLTAGKPKDVAYQMAKNYVQIASEGLAGSVLHNWDGWYD